MTLESLQNELIRDVLRVDNMDILKKVRNLLRREERKTTAYAEHVSAPSTVAEEAEPYMTKEEILANFDQACKELKLNLEGKLEFKKITVTPDFLREMKRLSKRYRSLKADLAGLGEELRLNPFLGTDLGHHLRKVRLAITSKGKGKSGGARVM